MSFRGRGRGRGTMNMSIPQTSANNRLKRFSQVQEENNNQMDVDVDIVETPVFEEKQPRGRGRGRRMGGFRGGRGGRGRATMNLTYPKQSANDRLQRSAEPIKPGQPKETNNNFYSKKDAQNQLSQTVDRRPCEGADGCICLRDMMRLFCEACGHVDEGRLRKTCKLHPRDVYLYDVTHCARCRRVYIPNGPKPRLMEFPLKGKPTKKLILTKVSSAF